MTDYFRVLGEHRRPWLEPDAVKQRFLDLSAQKHPDRLHNAPAEERQTSHEAFTELNRAYQVLSSHRERLRHLLELERGSKPAEVQEISPDWTEVFMDVHKDLREANAFMREREAITSPLLKVQQFAGAQSWIERLQQKQKSLLKREEELVAELKALDSEWPLGAPVSEEYLLRLEGVYRRFSYVSRWLAQMHELVIRLTL